MPELTFVSDNTLDVLLKTELIKEEWRQLILRYIIMQLAKRHRDSKMNFEVRSIIPKTKIRPKIERLSTPMISKICQQES
jgi:hypothetical protein